MIINFSSREDSNQNGERVRLPHIFGVTLPARLRERFHQNALSLSLSLSQVIFMPFENSGDILNTHTLGGFITLFIIFSGFRFSNSPPSLLLILKGEGNQRFYWQFLSPSPFFFGKRRLASYPKVALNSRRLENALVVG